VQHPPGILRQNGHNTPAYWLRVQWWSQSVCGDDYETLIGQWAGQDAGVTPLLFFKGHPEIFNDHRESGPWISGDSTVSPSLQRGVSTHTGLTNTNLVFPGGLPKYWPGSTLLGFTGQPFLSYRVITVQDTKRTL